MRCRTPVVAWGRCGDGDRGADRNRCARTGDRPARGRYPGTAPSARAAGRRARVRRRRRRPGRRARRGTGARASPRHGSRRPGALRRGARGDRAHHGCGSHADRRLWCRRRASGGGHRCGCRRRRGRARRARRFSAVRRVPPSPSACGQPGAGHHPSACQAPRASGWPSRGPIRQAPARRWSPSALRPAARPRWRPSSETSPTTSRRPSSSSSTWPRASSRGSPAGSTACARCRVVVAADGERISSGTVYLAPAGLNLSLRSGHRVELLEPPATQFHVPGIDRTFASVAEVCRDRAVGVLLTGMGRDGAQGLRTLRDVGAFTIGQDEATSVVWGMPAAAQQADAVDARAAPRRHRQCRRRSRRPGAATCWFGRWPAMTPLTDGDFALLRDYLRGTAGLEFDASRRSSLGAAIAERLRSSGQPGRRLLPPLLDRPDGAAERQRLLDDVTIQETHFHRARPQIDALREHLLPSALHRRRSARAAASPSGAQAAPPARRPTRSPCSPSRSGEGGRDRSRVRGPPIRVVGTDVSAAALDVARRARYSGRTIVLGRARCRDPLAVVGRRRATTSSATRCGTSSSSPTTTWSPSRRRSLTAWSTSSCAAT